MDYWQNVRMLYNWQKLNVVERDIVLALNGNIMKAQPPEFKGSYIDLTERLGRPKNHVSNIRRAAIDLEQRGLITIDRRHVKGWKKTITLRPDWQETLTHNDIFPDHIVKLCEVKQEANK